MSMKHEIEARGLERRAAEFERKARERDVEVHVQFSPRRFGFWDEQDRIDRYRKTARDLREQAAKLRRQNA